MTDDDFPEYGASFEGDCICDHADEDHGWGYCERLGSITEGCDCQAGWTE